MSFTLGMTGPIIVADFKDYLYPDQWRDDLPVGMGGTPVNLLCRELLNRGQRLVIFSHDKTVKDEVILEGENLRICLGPQGKRPARNFFRTEREYLAKAIKRERPDVIHAQWTYEFAMPVQTSGIPHVITSHDKPITVLRYNFIPYRIARTLMAYRVITRAKRIVSVSPPVAQHLSRFMGYRGSREVIANGMPDSVFAAGDIPRNQNHPFTFATILVGWVGYKNNANAIRAFALLRKTKPDARLLMFGADHGPGEFAEQWARSEGLAEGIEFVGMIPYPRLIERLRQEVSALLHPSLEEAQPMVLIEAMAQRIPVIGGRNSGGVPWTLGDGSAGLLVDVRNPEEMAEAMVRLSDDPVLYQEMVTRGQALARERFHISAVADAYQRIYAELAGAGK